MVKASEAEALGRRVARLEAQTKRLADDAAAARAELERLGLHVDNAGAKLDLLLLRVAAFSEGGAVLVLRKTLESELAPSPPGGCRDCAVHAGPGGLAVVPCARHLGLPVSLEAAHG